MDVENRRYLLDWQILNIVEKQNRAARRWGPVENFRQIRKQFRAAFGMCWQLFNLRILPFRL